MSENEKVDKMAELNATIKGVAQSYHENPEILAELYQFSTRFYRYSLNNKMLIYAQNPHSTYVGSFKFWKNQGYSVKKGKGSGIAIFVPRVTTYVYLPGKELPVKLSDIKDAKIKAAVKSGKIKSKEKLSFGVGYVFDISSTTCPKEDYPKLYQMGYDNKQYVDICNGLEEFLLKELHTEVSYKDMNSISLRGQMIVGENKIEMNELLNDTEKLSTLIHEGAHQLMHQKFDENKPISEIEFEADSFAIMLQSRYGLELEDGRKRHLADNYRKLKAYYQKVTPAELSEDEFVGQKIDEAINRSVDTFSQYKDIIDTYVEPFVQKKSMIIPEIKSTNEIEMER